MKESSNITILYVDDEEINLLLFGRSFSKKHNVLSAGSGREGLEILGRNENIDVVISDMRMTDMSGIEFIKLAKQEYPEKIYFILTGFVFGEEIESALKNKLIANSFSKPFNQDQIEGAIYDALH
ncbi:MAG: response regulator [Cyclobacteriaceae bacterium]